MYDRLQYISQGENVNEHIQNITLALDGGCKWIQLRLKNHSFPIIDGAASKVKQLCSQYKATFIVNDFINTAQQTGVDGVHLGLQDNSVATAREKLGSNKIIGGTANTYEDCIQRVKEGCNYIGLGPFRFTTTKEKLSPVLGYEGYREIMSQLKKNDYNIPVYAIGGIEAGDVERLMETGIYGIAISGAITKATDKKQVIELIYSELNTQYVTF